MSTSFLTLSTKNQTWLMMGSNWLPHLEQAGHLLHALSMASCATERSTAAAVAFMAWSDADGNLVDALCQAGAVSIVTLGLQRTVSEGAASLESIHALCSLLVLLLHCSSPPLAIRAFQQVGADLMEALFSVICFGPVLTADDPSNQLIEIVSEIHVSLPDSRRAAALIRLMQRVLRDYYTVPFLVEAACKLLNGWTVSEKSKIFVMQYPGLVEDVIKLCSITLPMNVRYYVASLLRQLAWEERNRPALATKAGFLRGLLRMYNETGVSVRLVILKTLQLEALCSQGSRAIYRYENGLILDVLLSAMDETLLAVPASHTILHLITRDRTLPLVKGRPNLVSTMAATAAVGSDSAVFGAKILKKLASHVSVHDKLFPDLMDLLLSLSEAESPEIRLWVAKAFVELSKDQKKRFAMIRTGNTVPALIRLVEESHHRIKASAAEALCNLTTDRSNAKRMTNDALEVLISTAQAYHLNYQSSRFAVKAILELSTNGLLKARLAKQRGLVEALCYYAISADEDEPLRKAALHTVISLAPLI